MLQSTRLFNFNRLQDEEDEVLSAEVVAVHVAVQHLEVAVRQLMRTHGLSKPQSTSLLAELKNAAESSLNVPAESRGRSVTFQSLLLRTNSASLIPTALSLHLSTLISATVALVEAERLLSSLALSSPRLEVQPAKAAGCSSQSAQSAEVPDGCEGHSCLR